LVGWSEVMRKNPLKEKLAQGQTVIGAFVRVAAPALVEICAYNGFDFVVLDAEHGPLGEETVEHLVRAAEVSGIPALVRVPNVVPSTILRFMDTGAIGVHVPDVNTKEDAVAAVSGVKYQPEGQRGLAGVRASGYGQLEPLSDYVRVANAESMVVAHIENIVGVRNIGEILEVQGLDVLYMGPVDLSNSLGIPGQTGDPRVQEAVAAAAQEVRDRGRVLGTIVRDVDSAKARMEEGYRYLVIGTEGLLGSAARAFLQGVRA
jgi:4-hydroxy-2-oxoheptanedioate aldolase